MLRLEAIKFNHDSSSANADAFNIRKNEREFVEVPEWCREVTFNPEDSLAAYARLETRENTLTIEVNFTCDDPNVKKVSIKALDPNFYRKPVNSSTLSEHELRLLQDLVPNPAGNLLGEVKANPLVFSERETGFQPFELNRVRIQDAGVSVQNIVWRWQYCVEGSEDWIDLAVTTHRIFTVLSVPNLPWLPSTHDPSNTHLPWVAVLEHACDWAAGAQNTDDAAAMITRRVYKLGPKVIRYAGSTYYTDQQAFDCSSFLTRLADQHGKGKRVNCDDCAAIVSTFANAIGCELSQMCITRKDKPYFGIKPHLRIGIAGQHVNKKFYHHQVASEGGCSLESEIFDACLKINSADPPVPSLFTLATNLPFVRAGEKGYRARLVVKADEPFTGPTSGTCRPRALGSATGLPESCTDRLLLEQHFGFSAWEHFEGPGGKVFVSDFFFTDYILSGLQLVGFQQSEAGRTPSAINSFWISEPGGEKTLLRIDVYETASPHDARKGLMTILTTLQEPGMVRQQTEGLGDVVFADPAFEDVLFTTGNLIFFLRNVDNESVPLIEFARAINNNVLSPPPGVTEPGLPATVKRFSFASSEALIGAKIKIREEPAQPPAQRRLYQFIAETGEVSVEGQELIYRPISAGVNTLKIFAADARGNALLQILQLKVE